MSESGKKLSELRVSDLKEELEKRDLDTVGAKATLVERLEKALKDEDIDPSTYLFGAPQISPSKKIDGASDDKEEQILEECEIKQEVEVHDEEDGDEGVAENDDYERGDEMVVDEVGTVDEFVEIYDTEDEEEDNQALADSNNHDNEESINLTIGEDEQNFLHDEVPDDKDKNTADDVTEANNTLNEEDEDEENEPKKNDDTITSTPDDDKEDNNDEDDSAVKTKKKEDKDATEKDNSNEPKSSSASKSNSQKDEKEKSSTAAATGVSSTAAAAASSAASADSKSSSKSSASSSRNLWVSGLSAFTRASDLKAIFSKYGKVIGAKVVTNTRTPGTRCYGYVTMSSSNDASRCIDHLHRTELHGRIISVERTKNEIGGSASTAAQQASATTNGTSSARTSSSSAKKKDEESSSSSAKKSTDPKDVSHKSRKPSSDDKKNSSRRSSRRTSRDAKDEKDKGTTNNSSSKNDKEKNSSKDDSTTTKEKVSSDAADKSKSETSSVKHRHHRTSKSAERTGGDRRRLERPTRTSADRERDRETERRQRERERERIRQREILSYQKIREERERQRLRERERELREEERRRREIRERQREEEARLADERKKLAQERERLEREKAELLRLERERQKLEREKIELERLELKRQQIKIMQTARIEEPTVSKRPVKRVNDDRYSDATDRKRSTANEGRFDAPPPPRFDATLASRCYDKKRDDYVSGGGGSSSSAKRDDYSSSKRSDYIAPKRDDYSGSKRSGAGGLVDDYSSIAKRSSNEYAAAVPKRGKREDYKREVEIRHIPAAGTSSYHSSREVNVIHKSGSSRYVEPESTVRSSVTFRRVTGSGSGIVVGDDRGDSRTTSGSSKRYDTGYGGGSDRNNSSGGGSGPANWQASSGHIAHSSHSSHGHSSAGLPPMKSFVSNGIASNIHSASGWPSKSADDQSWRQVPSQDRYDRTYNERSGPYMDSSRPSGGSGGGGIYSGGSGRQDRYGAPVSSSRYENGKY